MEMMTFQTVNKMIQTIPDSLTEEINLLKSNLQNHIGDKVKVSFLPNQYYNEKIYILTDYWITRGINGVTINLQLREGDIIINYRVEDVIKLEAQTFFNRIEYKAYVTSSEIMKEVYNFCLYF